MPEIVRCEACGFGYSAEHTNADGTYSCPLCELAAAEAALARATAAYDGGTRDLLADKRRLDWLANNATYVQPGKPLTTLMFDIPEGKSLRAAIDDCAPRP